MRSAFVVLAAIAASVVAGGPAAAAEQVKTRKAPSAEQAARLGLAAAEAARGTKVYIVRMAEQPASQSASSTASLAKSAPAKGQKYDARSSQAQMHAARLGASQDALLAKIGASGSKIYSYRHAMNGFAARLTAAQAGKLRKDKSVLNVWENKRVYVDTNNSPRFLGLLNEQEGLRARYGLRGENVIIGVIDTGIVQEHPSLDDTGYGPPPADWTGACQAGEGFAADDCNNKLIGARYYIDSFGEENVVEGEFISPRDSDGHGTHTATTAGGNENVQATLAGTPVAMISGIAPRARIAVYKACWQQPGAASAGCDFADTAAATDQAVADGVDILSFSVGTAFSFIDPQDIAFLFAADAGVFVSRSAGNEGPAPETTAAGEPWVTSVAASTQTGVLFALAATVNSPPAVAGEYAALESAVSKSLQETGPITNDLAAADPIDACVPLEAGSMAGRIGFIARGACDFVVKLANAVDAGAIAVLMYTNENPKTVMGGTADEKTLSIPAVMIDNAPGLKILAQLTRGNAVNVTLEAGNFIRERMKGNVMAGFSSRGPFPTVPDWVKPDITAPGVNILAGGTPEPNDGSFGGFFQYLSGTSMSTPHIAGVAALLLELHPDWTPAMVKSAIMTTARQNVRKEDGVTRADPFDLGSGHVFPNKADHPGLVYDAGFFDYLAGACGTDARDQLFGDPDGFCSSLEAAGFSLDPSDVNLPSIGIGALAGPQTVRRTVTNVGKRFARYTANIKPPKGYRVTVQPMQLALSPGESQTFTVTFENRNAPPGEWRFGSLTWQGPKGPGVRSPIAVRGQAVIVPEDINGTGASGNAPLDVTFGFTGNYFANPHGFTGPIVIPFQVADDPADTFTFLDGPDEVLVDIFEPAPGATSLEFALFDVYTDQAAPDLDLYVFYCPDFLCTEVGSSATITSNERVKVQFPVNDPAIDDPYVAIVHGFETAGDMANAIYFNWEVGPDTGTLAITPDTVSAVAGESTTLDVAWAGLPSGPAAKFVGDVSHESDAGIHALTTVTVENDAGFGYADVCAIIDCSPPAP